MSEFNLRPLPDQKPSLKNDRRQYQQRQEATLDLVRFHVSPPILVKLEFGDASFMKEVYRTTQRKTSESRPEPTINKLSPHMAPGRNGTQATLLGIERSRHCANRCFPKIEIFELPKYLIFYSISFSLFYILLV